MNKFPKIGIRPTIDGRLGGVRESLEDQVMNMAKRAAAFLSSHLKYPNGQPVECVVADSTIGGIKEANACADKFKRENVGVSLTVTPCWCYGTETIDMEPALPKAIWGFNGTERPGAVYLAAALAGHNQKGIPAFGIYGRDVQNADDETIPHDVQEKLLRFAKSALAVSIMRGKSYLSIGGVSMGIAGSVVDADFFQCYLGMRNEYVESIELLRRIDENIYDHEEYKMAREWVRKNCAEGLETNNEPKTAEQKEKEWDKVVKMAIITRDLMVGNPKLSSLGFGEEANGHDALVAGFQGQRQWTDYQPNGDFMEAILSSSFDWNGLRPPHIVATENDALNGATMLLGYLLTNTAQMFSDIRTFWSPDAVERATGERPTGMAQNGFIHLINSGASALDFTGDQQKDGKPVVKPFWEITDHEVSASLASTKWCPAVKEYFRGGGFSSQFNTKGGMPITVSRLNLVKGIGPVLQIAEGYTVELSDQMHHLLTGRTNPTWPTTWFVPNLTGEGAFKDVYSVMANWGANHCASSYGHIGADLITMASILRIPVNMHNVSEDKIYRPTAWNMLGSDKEGADFRACALFGPLYK